MAIGPSFPEVLAAAQANAGWAFERLYQSLAPAVAGYARAQGAQEPEVTTSEVFLAAFSRLGSFVGNEVQLRSLVFTIAHHRIVDERRFRARRPPPESLDVRRSDAGVAGPRAATTASAEDCAFEALGTERVQALLGRLPADQRDVLVLRVVGDLTVDQVAAALDKSPGAVKALQRRALAKLRKELSAEGVTL